MWESGDHGSGNGVAGGGDWRRVMVVMVLMVSWPHSAGTERPSAPFVATAGLACRALSALVGTGSPDLCFFPKKPKLHYSPLQNQPPPGIKHGDCRVCGASYRVTLPVSAHVCVCMCV